MEPAAVWLLQKKHTQKNICLSPPEKSSASELNIEEGNETRRRRPP
jgi:hypothetical protein